MGTMLKISEGVSLGMHAMTVCAGRPGELVSTAALSELLQASGHHLAKIMQRLVKAGLLRSVRGPRGGFELCGDPRQITLLDVYEAVEGRFQPSDCILSKKICTGKRCICGDLIRETNRKVYEHLKNTHLSDLTDVM